MSALLSFQGGSSTSIIKLLFYFCQILATAVRMCKWDKALTVRAEAAETLGNLRNISWDLHPKSRAKRFHLFSATARKSYFPFTETL